jgi:hypothetical protein
LDHQSGLFQLVRDMEYTTFLTLVSDDMIKTSISGFRTRFSSRAGLCAFVAAAFTAPLFSACSDDEDTDGAGAGSAGVSGSGAGGSDLGGSGGMAGTAGSGMAGSGGSGMTAGPTGTVEVLTADASLTSPTTVAIRGDLVFTPLAQFDELFPAEGMTAMPDPFQAVSVPLAGGALGDSVALPDDYYPEGIAAAADGTLYIGSMTTGGIQRVPADSTTAEEFIAGGAVADRGVVGLTVDRDRDILWFCDSNPVAASPVAELVGVSTAAATEGDEVARHVLSSGDTAADAGAVNAFCNDVIVTPDGDLLITESRGSVIYRVPSADALTNNSAELWSTAPELQPPPGGFGVNGLAMVGDMLIVANNGLFVMDPASPDSATLITLTGADAAFVGAPDGLALVPGSTTELVVADNGGRIIKVTLDLD